MNLQNTSLVFIISVTTSKAIVQSKTFDICPFSKVNKVKWVYMVTSKAFVISALTSKVFIISAKPSKACLSETT